MDVLVLAVICIAIAYAIRGAGRGVAKSYDNSMNNWRAENPDAANWQHRAAVAGNLAALLRHGPRALWEGMKEGWQEGWAAGVETVARFRPDPKPQVVEPQPPDPTSQPPDPPPAGPEQEPAIAQPPSSPATNPPIQTKWLPPPTEPLPPANGTSPNGSVGGNPVSTIKNIEINTVQDLLAALKAKQQRATLDQTDASNALARANQEKAQTDGIIAAMKKKAFSPGHIKVVSALIDPESQSVAAAKQRLAAQTNAANASGAAVKMAAKHVEMAANGAAGQVYQGG